MTPATHDMRFSDARRRTHGRWLCWLFLLSFAFAASAQHMGLVVRDAKSPPGAEVTTVTPGTPAAKAELQPGDVIVAVQGAAVATADQFIRAAHAVPAGSVVRLRVARGGWEKDVQLQSPAVRASYGFAVKEAPPGGGVAIASVDPGGAAAGAGLAVGDRVTRIDGRAPADVRRVQAQIDEAAGKGAILALVVERGGWAKEVTLAPQPVGPSPPVRTSAAAVAAGAPLAAAPPAAAPSTLLADMDEANRQYDSGHWREAEAAYRRLLQTAADDPRVWGRLCHVLVMQERFADAVETCQRAAGYAPAEAGIYQNIGYSHARLGKHGDAVAAYQKAIERAPDWPAPYAGAAAAYFAQRNWPKAEEYYRLTVARDPKNRAAWQALGDVAGEQGKSGEAIAHYRKALEMGPAGPGLLGNLGWQLYRERRYAEAETVLLDANRATPTDVPTLMSLGAVEEKLGKTAEARQAWQRAAALDPAGPNGALARQNLAALASASPPAGAPGPAERGAPAGDAVARTAPPPAPAPAAGSGAAPAARQAPAAAMPGPAVAARSPDARAAPVPPAAGGAQKAAIAIGDFQVKAANAGQYVGDGLREMLLTALHGSGRFVVVERMDIKGLAAEQALSRSRMARPGESIPEGQMEVADVLVYGAVTEFEPEVRGGGLSIGMPNVPLTLGMQGKTAHMAIDIRLVDVASGRVLATGRIVGEARSTQATLGANISARGVTMPATLGGFQNTPMEQAIRECIEKATAYVGASMPPAYFHHS